MEAGASALLSWHYSLCSGFHYISDRLCKVYMWRPCHRRRTPVPIWLGFIVLLLKHWYYKRSLHSSPPSLQLIWKYQYRKAERSARPRGWMYQNLDVLGLTVVPSVCVCCLPESVSTIPFNVKRYSYLNFHNSSSFYGDAARVYPFIALLCCYCHWSGW